MNFKIFLPIENYTLTTNLKVEEASKRLSEKIGPKRTLKAFFWGNVTTRPYEGYLVSNAFEINRIIGYKNSFLPIISGLIYTIAGKTYIKVEMKIVYYILIPIMIVIGLGLLVSMFNAVGSQFLPGRVVPFLITLFAYFLAALM